MIICYCGKIIDTTKFTVFIGKYSDFRAVYNDEEIFHDENHSITYTYNVDRYSHDRYYIYERIVISFSNKKYNIEIDLYEKTIYFHSKKINSEDICIFDKNLYNVCYLDNKISNLDLIFKVLEKQKLIKLLT